MATHRVIRLPEVINKTGICRTTIYRMEGEGTFPKSIPLGGKAIGWIEAEVDAWIEQQMATRQPQSSTAAPTLSR